VAGDQLLHERQHAMTQEPKQIAPSEPMGECEESFVAHAQRPDCIGWTAYKTEPTPPPMSAAQDSVLPERPEAYEVDNQGSGSTLYYLVSETDACMDALEAELSSLSSLKTCGMVELMLANPNVDSFVREKEAELASLRSKLSDIVAAIDNERIVSCIGTFELGDDPKKAIGELMLWSQGVGEYFALEKLRSKSGEDALAEIKLYRPEIKRELLDVVNEQPLALSMLYDLNLLPEQLASLKEMTVGLFAAYNRLEGILLAFKAQALAASPEAESKHSVLPEECEFCLGAPDHKHSNGRNCCGDCCTMHGFLSSVDTATYEWVRKIIDAHSEREKSLRDAKEDKKQ
jgi:hypothetical protein